MFLYLFQLLEKVLLEELGVNVFEDYLIQLPSVTAGGAGPGTSTIYIRGLASTTTPTSLRLVLVV